MGRKDYQKGMVAGAKPFEEMFEQHAKSLKDIQKEINVGINEIGEVQDDLIDISEEHEEQLENINKKVSLGLDERENLNVLTENEKEILGGIILSLSQVNDFSPEQKEFVSNIFRNLGLSHPQRIEIETIENVESTRAQKIMFRVLCELLFLNDNSFEFANDLIDYFSINKKSRETIFSEIVLMYNTIGDEGIIKKYSVSEIEPKRSKKYPKLEISTDIETYNEDISFTAELDMGDDFDVECETYRTEKECRTAIDNVICKYYNEEMRYILPTGDRFVGRNITLFYSNQVLSIVNEILDFINIHNLRIDVESLIDIKEKISDDVLTMIANKINSEICYSVLDWENYSAMIKIEEVEDFAETLFGGFKEVIRYQESDRGTNVLEIAEQMEQEINRLIGILEKDAFSYILEKYIIRIGKFVNELNIKTGNS